MHALLIPAATLLRSSPLTLLVARSAATRVAAAADLLCAHVCGSVLPASLCHCALTVGCNSSGHDNGGC
jgi:hypothetical protein